MNYRAVAKYIGYALLIEGVLMLPPLLIASYCREQASIHAFLIVIFFTVALGFLLSKLERGDAGVYAREAFVTVALVWIVISFFGMLPFYISRAIPSLIDCWFESVSGFTTTGATVLSDVEALPKSMLYWRSFSHWIGGMGVLVFMLAVAPVTRGGGESFMLLRTESTGPSVGKLRPKLRETARILYIIYVALTIIEIILLMAGGMSVFESVLHAFGTAGTGGFSTRNSSITAYNSAYIEMVIAVFMVVFSVNFSLYYALLLRQVKDVFKNEELRLYLGIVAATTIAITIDLVHSYGENAVQSLRHAFFQVSSMISTTGYTSADYNSWPEISRFLLLMLMLCGACAGSTAGGIKLSRVIIATKSLTSHLVQMLRPRAVKPVRMDGKVLDDSIVRGTSAYITAFLAVFLISIFIVTLEEKDLITNLTSVIACIGNVGPGLGKIGPTGNFGLFSITSKLALSADMLFGRLELFPMILLFMPSTWKRKA